MTKSKLSVAQLYQGLSQQPHWRRQSGQVDECVNFRLDPLEGARKRNATELVADLSLLSSDSPNVLSLRNFQISILPNSIQVFDRDTGLSVPVSAPNGYGYLNGSTATSIDTTAAIDTVIVLNRNIVPQTTTTPAYTVAGTVNVYSALPASAEIGQVYRVRINENYDTSGFYLKVDPTNPVIPAGFYATTITNGWMKVPASADPDGRYDTTTMPHRLVYNPGSNSFTFDRCPWRDRYTGNSITNKRMPWVGVGLQSVCFHQGRLFLIGRDVITSGAAAPNQSVFNLYVEDINGVVDSDRISIDINLANIGKPLRCLGVGNDLFINCENGQLSFSSADQPLTGTNGRYRQVADFRTPDVPLASNGSEIAVLDQYSQVQLFKWVDQINGIQFVGGLNDHTPTLLKDYTVTRLFFINSTIFAATSTSSVFVHERFGVGGEIIQLAWSEYRFYEPTVYMDGWKNGIYMLQKGPTAHSVVKYQHVKNTDDNDNFQPRMDRRQTGTVSASFAVYDGPTNRTAFNLSAAGNGRAPTTAAFRVLRSDGTIIAPVSVSGSIATMPGNLVGVPCTWGFVYDAVLTLSKIYAGTSDVRVTLSRVVLGLKDSTNCNVTIGQVGSTQRTESWSATDLHGYLLGAPVLYTGTVKWVAVGNARSTNITITCNDAGTVTVSFVELHLQVGDN